METKTEKGGKANTQGEGTSGDIQEPGEIEPLLEAWPTKYIAYQMSKKPRNQEPLQKKTTETQQTDEHNNSKTKQQYKEDNIKHSEQANQRDAEHRERQPKKSTPKKKRNMQTTSR